MYAQINCFRRKKRKTRRHETDSHPCSEDVLVTKRDVLEDDIQNKVDDLFVREVAEIPSSDPVEVVDEATSTRYSVLYPV